MITESLYQTYVQSLLQGNKSECLDISQTLLEKDVEIRELYIQLFQKSMYEVGELWERNEISVAREHMATSITESLLSATYPYLFSGETASKKAVISCTANEYHQLGGKMVADIFELHGWDSHFIGANTPPAELLHLIDEIQPDLVGLSLSVYFNLPSLKTALETIRGEFYNLDILVGGHAFAYGGTGILKNYTGTHYVESLYKLEDTL